MRNGYWGLYQSLIMRHSLGFGCADQDLASAVRLKDHATKLRMSRAAATLCDSLRITPASGGYGLSAET